jgi:hypothetical protein
VTSDQDTLDEITARLIGHDPKHWYAPRPSAVLGGVSPPNAQWYVMRLDSHLEYFASSAQAWRFHHTGVKPDGQ